MSNTVFHYESAMAGSGKTHRAIKDIKRITYDPAQNVIMALPTEALIQEVLDKLTATKDDNSQPINPCTNVCKITTTTLGNYPHAKSVREALQDEIKNINNKADQLQGRVILTSHASLFNLHTSDCMNNWSLFIDEVPQVIGLHTIHLELDNEGADIKNLKALINWEDPQDVLATAGKKGILEDIRDGVSVVGSKNRSQEMIALCGAVISDFQQVKLQKPLKEGNTQKLNFVSQVKSSIFSAFKRVMLLAANIEKSLLFLLWSKEIEFQQVDVLQELAKGHPAHKGEVEIHYLFERTYSKSTHTCPKDSITTPEAILETVEGFYKTRCDDWVFCVNAGMERIVPNSLKSKRIAVITHGLNKYRNQHGFAYLCAINPDPITMSYLRGQGLSDDDIRRAYGAEVAYQAVCRTSVRNAKSDGKKKYFVVGDKFTAEILQSYFEGSTVHKLEGLEEFEAGTSGRPTSEFTADDRRKADSILNRHKKGKAPTKTQLKWLNSKDYSGSIMSFVQSVLSYFNYGEIEDEFEYEAAA